MKILLLNGHLAKREGILKRADKLGVENAVNHFLGNNKDKA